MNDERGLSSTHSRSFMGDFATEIQILIIIGHRLFPVLFETFQKHLFYF